MEHRRRFLVTILVPNLLLLVGTLGYYFIEENWSLLDALYMTVITLTTIGFSETHPLSPGGRVFTIFLALGGIFTVFYAAGALIRSIVSGEVHAMVGERHLERTLSQLINHLIVCGFGRMGRLVCQEFSEQGLPFVIIDRREEVLTNFTIPHGVPMIGDATSDDVLTRAGIERARALVTVVASDADNLYITMSARFLNDKLFIVARAEDINSEPKLLRAGASRVVSPYQIGGQRVAQAVLRPTVVDFLELATKTQHFDLQIEEVRIGPASPLAGSTLQDSRLRRDLGVIILTIKKASGQMLFNPPPESPLQAGDILIAIGDREHLDRLEAMANPARPGGTEKPA